jgi:pimeloyl-ACP methyl ester carboxylesterase
LDNASRGIRILYSSTNGLDNKTPIAVSSAVYFPKGQTPPEGWPVIAWAHGTTGLADVCAPSWTVHTKRDADYLDAWLAQGYAIVATDYQGLGTLGGHPWMTVRPEAYSVLDSVRVALKTFSELSNSIVIVGQSQGAQAAVSAALLSDEYYAELHLKGTVATGVPGGPPFAPKTKASQISVPPRASGPLLPAFFLLESLTYRVIDPRFNPSDFLSDTAILPFKTTTTGCLPEVAQATQQAHLTIDNEFKQSPDQIAAKTNPYRQYPRLKFARPVFVGTGLADTTIAPEIQYNFVVAACAEGSIVEAHYYQGQDHLGTPNAALVDSVPFVKKLLAGQPTKGNCGSFEPPNKER